MRFWWVNQNQTFTHEIRGGYLWSPKRKRNGHRNPFYESMREVAPGDLVLSFATTRLVAVGVVRSHAYEAPKPEAFGAAGRNWDAIGWRVDVAFRRLDHAPRPADWIDLLRPLLPPRHSPLLPDGRGNQSAYLIRLDEALALTLAGLCGDEVLAQFRQEAVAEPPDTEEASRVPEILLWEDHLEQTLRDDPNVADTEREALIRARRGQGTFRSRVLQFERRCRVTRVDRLEHLRASHCKPWRDASNVERLDGHNGLLLTPSIDHLFDRGFVSFRDDGTLLVSPVAHAPSLQRMGVPTDRVLETWPMRDEQLPYLEFHRDAVFLRSSA